MNDKIKKINDLLNKLNEEERQIVLDSYTSQELLRKVWNNNDVIVPNYYDVDYNDINVSVMVLGKENQIYNAKLKNWKKF